MVKSLVSLKLLLVLALVVAVVVRLPVLRVTPGGGGNAPQAVHTAVSLIAAPQDGTVAAQLASDEPSGPPLLLRALYEVALILAPRSGFPTHRFRVDALVAEGSEIPTHWARGLWLVLELILIGLAFAVARSVTRLAVSRTRLAASAAPLIVALSPVAISGAVRVDGAVPASTLALAAWWFVLAAPRSGDQIRWTIAGFLLGLSIAFHPLALLAAAVFVRGAVVYRGVDIVTRLGPALVAALLGLALGDPRFLTAPGVVIELIRTEAFGTPPLGHMWAGVTAVRGLSPVPLLLVLAALPWVAMRSTRCLVVAALVPVAGLLALPSAGHSALILVLPFIAILASLGIARLEIVSRARWIPGALLLACTIWPLALSLDQIRRADRGDSRHAAAEWLARHLPEDARVVTDFYGPALPGERWVSFVLPFTADDPRVYAGAYQLGWYEGFDTFILVGTQFDRYRRDPNAHGAQLAFFDRLRSYCERVALFSNDDYAGPTIVIFRRREPVTPQTLRMMLDREAVDPPVPDFYLSLGGAYARMGRGEDALALYRIAERLAPEDPRVALNLAGVYLERGDVMSADEILGRAVHEHPDDARLRYQYGIVKQRRRLWGEAIGEYKMAVRSAPGFVEAHYNLAICYLEAGNTQGAINSFRRVLDLASPGEMRDESERVLRELGALR